MSSPRLVPRGRYVELLTSDETPDESIDESLPIVLRLFGAAAREVNSEYEQLLAEQEEEDDDDDDDDGGRRRRKKTGGSKKRALRAKQEEEAVALHAHLGKCLGPLLLKYGAHAEPLRGVLALLRELKLHAAQVCHLLRSPQISPDLPRSPPSLA